MLEPPKPTIALFLRTMQPLDILGETTPPIQAISADVDFVAMLRESIQTEGECDEALPGRFP